MNEIWEKIKLYVLSLWLLFVLVLILKINIPIYFGPDWEFIGIQNLIILNIIPLVCLLFIIIGIICFLTFDYKLEGAKNLPFKISNVENANYEHLAFLATYILPLICFNFDDIRYVIILFLVLIIIGAIYVKTNIFYANPTLALLGFKIFRAKNDNGTSIIIISKNKISDNDYIRTIKLDENIFYGRRTDK